MKKKEIFLLIGIWLFSGKAMLFSETPLPPKVISLDLPLTVLYQRDTSSSLTELRILVPAGIRSVNESLRGLSLLTARLALEIPSAQQVKEMVEMGSQFSSWSTADYAVLSITSLSNHFEKTLAISTAILKKPLITGIRIQRIKKWMESRGKTAADSPPAVMQEFYNNYFLRKHGYGGSVYGTIPSRERLSGNHVRELMRQMYTLRKMCVSIVTNLHEKEVRKLIAQYFHDIPGRIETSPVQPLGQKDSSLLRTEVDAGDRDLLQPLLAWGYALPELDRHNYACARLLARWIARGVGSRAWRLRVRDGLAYTVDAAISSFSGGGALIFFLRTGPDKISHAEREMENILDEVLREGITATELDAVRRIENAAWLRSMQSKGERAWRMAEFYQNGLGLEEVLSGALLQEISPEKLNAFARRYLAPELLKKFSIGVPVGKEKD